MQKNLVKNNFIAENFIVISALIKEFNVPFPKMNTFLQIALFTGILFASLSFAAADDDYRCGSNTGREVVRSFGGETGW